jgi:hypothetical protein
LGLITGIYNENSYCEYLPTCECKAQPGDIHSPKFLILSLMALSVPARTAPGVWYSQEMPGMCSQLNFIFRSQTALDCSPSLSGHPPDSQLTNPFKGPFIDTYYSGCCEAMDTYIKFQFLISDVTISMFLSGYGFHIEMETGSFPVSLSHFVT